MTLWGASPGKASGLTRQRYATGTAVPDRPPCYGMTPGPETGTRRRQGSKR
jgi:hypothetical protein